MNDSGIPLLLISEFVEESEKYVFYWAKWNFEHIGNYVYTAELLALGSSLNNYIDYLMFYPSRQHMKWKHFKYKFRFNNDFMMITELNLCKVRFRCNKKWFWACTNLLLTLYVRVRSWDQVLGMNFSSVNFDRCWKLFISLPARSDIMKMHFSRCITILFYTAQNRKSEKFINIYWNIKSLRSSSITPFQVAYKELSDISYENTSLRIPKIQYGYFLTPVAFWFVKYLSRWMGKL